MIVINIFKVALGVCFALKFVERRFTSFHIFNNLIQRCNFSANYKIYNKQVSELFICKSNTELICGLTD